MSKGIVYLVGAGPGDYKLITVKGLECIEKADVIVYDRLADERLLAYAKADVELIYVGKAASDHTMCQEEINRLLVTKGQQGKTVVRLKGGDPFVFGRGGEEALELFTAGVPFEVVPGITSAVAVPAYAGIPVTHRGIAASFTVVTGHEDHDKSKSSICWDKLALGADTLVFLMGVENLPKITAKLITNGRSSDTPAGIISWGTKPEQEVLVTTLGQAAEDAARQSVKPPAIFIVGEVVTLRDKLAWFDNKLLSGKTVLVTRARQQASLLTAALEAMGARCIEAPAIRIVPPDSYICLDEAVTNLSLYDWLIFTSVNGVEYFFARLHVVGGDSRALAGVKVAAIGIQTAAKLREFGVIADVVPAEFRAEGIIRALEDKIRPGMRVLIPRAGVARDVLPEKLAELGAVVEVVEAYRTAVGEADGQVIGEQLAAGKIDLVTFTSSSTVTNMLTLLGHDAVKFLSKAMVAAIGPITAETCLNNGIHPNIIAEEFTIAGLVKAIGDFYIPGRG
ncbi:MAG: uroporphyrin-III C-methyltransferase [Firmicutes bacterium]|nr:uroporphyrin-III C-methyltransferase [Bacillota bacterium]